MQCNVFIYYLLQKKDSYWVIKKNLFSRWGNHSMMKHVMSYETPKVVTVHNPQIGLLRNCWSVNFNYFYYVSILNSQLSFWIKKKENSQHPDRRALQLFVVLYVALYQLWYAQVLNPSAEKIKLFYFYVSFILLQLFPS